MMMQSMGGRRSHTHGASGNCAIAVCVSGSCGGRVTPIRRAIDALLVLDAPSRIALHRIASHRIASRRLDRPG